MKPMIVVWARSVDKTIRMSFRLDDVDMAVAQYLSMKSDTEYVATGFYRTFATRTSSVAGIALAS